MKYTMRRALALGVAAATLFQGPAFGEQTNQARSPIKHIIYILGENRSFDNIYATYIPKHGEAVANLLSKGIVNQDGSPGRNFDAGEQRRVVSMGHTYSIAPQLKYLGLTFTT